MTSLAACITAPATRAPFAIAPPAVILRLPELAIVPELPTLFRAFSERLNPPDDANSPPAWTYILLASITALVTDGLVDKAINLPASTKLPLSCSAPKLPKLSKSFTPCGITRLLSCPANAEVRDTLPPTALPPLPIDNVCLPDIICDAATNSAGVSKEEELTSWLTPPTFILIVLVSPRAAAEILACVEPRLRFNPLDAVAPALTLAVVALG